MDSFEYSTDEEDYTLKESQRKAGVFSRLSDFYDDFVTSTKAVSLGARTARAFRQLGGVIREWFANIRDFIVNLFPERERKILNEGGFGALLVDSFSRLYDSAKDMFERLYDTITGYFKSEKLPDDAQVPASTFVERVESVVEQAGVWDAVKGTTNQWYLKVVEFVTALMQGLTDLTVPSPSEVVASLSKYLSFANLCETVANKDLRRASINYLYRLFSGKHYYEDYEYLALFQAKYREITASIARFDDSKSIPWSEALSVTNAFATFDLAYQRLLQAFPAYGNSYKTMRETLYNSVLKFRACSQSSTRRIRPVSACFFGKAATGKSTLENYIDCNLYSVVLDVFKMKGVTEGDPFYDEAVLHSKCLGSWNLNCAKERPKFAQDYSYQPMIHFQEIYTSTQQSVNDDWSGFYFGCIDDQPLLLDRAFGDKGQVYLNSPFVTATGNGRHHIPMEDHNAYYRRIDFDCIVTRAKKHHGTYATTLDEFRDTCKIKLSSKCQEILANKDLAPHSVIPKRNLGRSFGPDEIVYCMAALYVERCLAKRNATPLARTILPPSWLDSDSSHSSDSDTEYSSSSSDENDFDCELIVKDEQPKSDKQVVRVSSNMYYTPYPQRMYDYAYYYACIANNSELEYRCMCVVFDMQAFMNKVKEEYRLGPEEVGAHIQEFVRHAYGRKVHTLAKQFQDNLFLYATHYAHIFERLIGASIIKDFPVTIGDYLLTMKWLRGKCPVAPLEEMPKLPAKNSIFEGLDKPSPLNLFDNIPEDFSDGPREEPMPAVEQQAGPNDYVRYLNIVFYSSPIAATYAHAFQTAGKMIDMKLYDPKVTQRMFALKESFGIAGQYWHYADDEVNRETGAAAVIANDDMPEMQTAYEDVLGKFCSSKHDPIIAYNYLRRNVSHAAAQAHARCDGDAYKGKVYTLDQLVLIAKGYMSALTQLRLHYDKWSKWLIQQRISSPFLIRQCQRMSLSVSYCMDCSAFQKKILSTYPNICKNESDILVYSESMLRARDAYIKKVMKNQQRQTTRNRRIQRITAVESARQSETKSKRKKGARTWNRRDRRIRKEGVVQQGGCPVAVKQFDKFLEDYHKLPWYSWAKHPYANKVEFSYGELYQYADYKKWKHVPAQNSTLARVTRFRAEYLNMIPPNATARQQHLAIEYIAFVLHENRSPEVATLLLIITQWYKASKKVSKKSINKQHIYNEIGKIPKKFPGFVSALCVGLPYSWHIAEKQHEMNIGSMVLAGAITLAAYKFIKPLVTWILSYFGETLNQIKVVTCDLAADIMDKLNAYAGTTGIYLQSGENKHTVPKVKPNDVVSRLRAEQQDGSMDTLTNSIAMNQYMIGSESGNRIGHLLFLKGTVAIINTHVFAVLPSQFSMFACRTTLASKREYNIHKNMLTHIGTNDDVMFISFGAAIRSHRDITSYLPTRNELKKFTTPSACWAVHFDVNTLQSGMEPLTDYEVCTSPLKLLDTTKVIYERLQYTWINAKAGACGTPVCAILNGSAKLVGFHRAGLPSNKLGISSPLYVELFTKMEASVPVAEAQCGALISLTDEEKGIYSYDYNKCAYVTPKHTSAVGITQFVPTPFELHQFKGGSPKVPAILNSTAYANALVKETSLINEIYLRPEVHTILVEHSELIMQKFCDVPITKLAGCRTLTFDEAMYGFSDVLDPFDWSTSEGIRLPLLGIEKKNLSDPESADTAKLRDYVNAKIENFKNGDFTLQINADCLKDELRDKERVAARKTRCFNVTDFVDNVLVKMAIGCLVARLKRHMLMGPAMCGINPTASIWAELYRKFEGKPVIFTDISGWDHTAGTFLGRAILPWICKLYGGDPNKFEAKFAMWAYISATQAIRFNNGVGRRLNRGGSSGNWATTFLNTINNHVDHSIVWIYLATKNGDMTEENYKQHFDLILYSDDNISSSPFTWWNYRDVANTFRELLGMLLTTTAKVVLTDNLDLRETTIDDADFLSRKFVKRDGIVYAPLDLVSVLSQLYYVRSHKGATSDFMHQQLQQNVNNVARELMEFPAHEAMHLLADIRDFVYSHNIPIVVPCYNYTLTRGAYHKLEYY